MAPPCELRRRRPSDNGATIMVCGAGDFDLGLETETDWEPMCTACPIPGTVAVDPRRCLHLRPIKVEMLPAPLSAWQHYFTCRWFYRLTIFHPPTTMDPCHGCPYWFPRPDMAAMEPLGYWQETHTILDAVRHPGRESWQLSTLSPSVSSSPAKSTSLLPRILKKFGRWWTQDPDGIHDSDS